MIRGVVPKCHNYGECLESNMHLFFECAYEVSV